MAASRTAQPESVPDMLVALGLLTRAQGAVAAARVAAPLGRAVLGRHAGDASTSPAPRAGSGRGSWPWSGLGCWSGRRSRRWEQLDPPWCQTRRRRGRWIHGWSWSGWPCWSFPGPDLLLVTAGLALLATEFAWAQRWLTRLRGHAKRAVHRVWPAKPSA